MAGGKIFADELGSESLRISNISGFRETLASGGSPEMTGFFPAPDDTPTLVLARFAEGDGTERIARYTGYYGNNGAAQVMGRVNAVDPGSQASVYGVGSPASFVNGRAVAHDTGIASVKTGAVYGLVGSQFVSGYVKAEDNSRGEIDAYAYGGPGCFVSGAIFAQGNYTCRIVGYGTGAFAQGAISDPYGAMTSGGLIIARGNGSHASGFITTSGGAIATTADGATARGTAANDGEVRGRAHGAFAVGYANTYDIDADGIGSFATGDATAGNIEANGRNTQQFGVGNNLVADSAQFGVGIRLHHLAAIPGAPANGSVWSDGTNVGIHSAGANQIFNQPTVTGAKAGNAALTSLLTGLAAMGIIVDSTT